MLTDIEVFNSRIANPPLPIPDGDGPLQIRKVDGLGPVDATVSTTKYGSIDGEFEQGSTIGKRNILITVGLQPDWATQTVEFLRQCLYQYFMPKSKVRLRLTSTHMETVEITGTVESFDPNIFSKDPEYVISVICSSPDFVAINPTSLSGTTVALGANTPTTINYVGTRPTGFLLVTSKGGGPDLAGGEFRIKNENPLASLFIATNVTINATYNLSVSTNMGSKYARSTPAAGGTYTNVLGKVAASSSWHQFLFGPNKFQVQTATPGQHWDLLYYNRYGGM